MAAVLCVTGAGESNAVWVLTHELPAAVEELRVVTVDTHGEYAGLAGQPTTLSVRFEPYVLDEGWVKRAARAGRQLGEVTGEVAAALEDLGPGADRTKPAEALRSTGADGGLGTRLACPADAIDAAPNLCLDAATVIEETDAPVPTPVDRSAPGLYVLYLPAVDGAAKRIRRAGAVAERLLVWAKRTGGAHPARPLWRTAEG